MSSGVRSSKKVCMPSMTSIWNKTNKKQKAAIFTGVALLALAGIALLAKYGYLGHMAQKAMDGKILPFFAKTLPHWMESKVPAWTIPAGVGGAIALPLLGYGIKRGIEKAKQAYDQRKLEKLDEENI